MKKAMKKSINNNFNCNDYFQVGDLCSYEPNISPNVKFKFGTSLSLIISVKKNKVYSYNFKTKTLETFADRNCFHYIVGWRFFRDGKEIFPLKKDQETND